MATALTEFVNLLVGGVTTLGTGIANGVANMASALLLEVADGAVTGLSVFGGIIALFAGIGLAVGVTTKVYYFVTNLGK